MATIATYMLYTFQPHGMPLPMVERRCLSYMQSLNSPNGRSGGCPAENRDCSPANGLLWLEPCWLSCLR